MFRVLAVPAAPRRLIQSILAARHPLHSFPAIQTRQIARIHSINNPTEEEAMLLDTTDLAQLRADMHKYDELRETIIKQSRGVYPPACHACGKSATPPADVQKLSKQAIFSLHRGNGEEAAKRLDQAVKAAQQILPLIEQEPTLRGGSFSSAMEEV